MHGANSIQLSRTKALAAFSRLRFSFWKSSQPETPVLFTFYKNSLRNLVIIMTEGCLTTPEETQWKLARVSECMQSSATCMTVSHLPISHSSDWTCGKLREFKKEGESVHRVLLIKNEFAISALRNLLLAARLCHVPKQRDSGISAPRAASWLRSAALRAQAAVAPEWCHVVGIYSSKFNFQLSFLPWQKPCLWDFSIQLSLCGSSGMMRGTDPSVILPKKKHHRAPKFNEDNILTLYAMITW